MSTLVSREASHKMPATIQLVLGNQLFPIAHLPAPDTTVVFMAEDYSLCTNVRHHKQKLILFLAAMRNYADELRACAYDVRYHALDPNDGRSYEEKLSAVFEEVGADRLSIFEIEDKFMEARLERWATELRVRIEVATSPMFLCARERFAEYLQQASTPRMAAFYRQERRRLGLLVDEAGRPAGGRWSFDTENRKRLPASIEVPDPPVVGEQTHVSDVTRLVEAEFGHHPGSAGPFWLPVTREAAIRWLDAFVDERLAAFGPYEDAISQRSRTLFHSILSPILNLGLITPSEVLDKVMARAATGAVPIASLEGFVRQIVGWREFIRGIYRHYSDDQSQRNFFDHHRRLGSAWYEAKTGISPLDDAISGAWKSGWDHHIARLMIVGNLMTLCEIEPTAAHRWFMEMYVDSSDWVMGPNVYGMALYSDGGIFGTKPYICGSNYLLKMSDYRRGPWCETVDGLYWRFIDKHRKFFASNPRLAVMPRALDRLDTKRKACIFDAAEAFLEEHTHR